MDPNEYFGFIYIITNNLTNKSYCGRKQFVRGGRKGSRDYGKEHNWRQYTGSCKALNEDIAKLGKDNFTFECIGQVYTKGALVWWEVYAQVTMEVLTATLPDGSRAWYNGQIAAIKFIPKESVSQSTKDKMSKTMSEKWKQNEYIEKVVGSMIGVKKKSTTKISESISKRLKGKPKSGRMLEQAQEAVVKAQEVALRTVACPHCGKEGTLLVLKRWHFDNCKKKINNAT